MIGLILGLVILTGQMAQAGGPKQAPGPKKITKKEAPAPEQPAPKAKPAPEKPAPPQAKPEAKSGGIRKAGLKIRIRARDVYFGRYRSFRKPAVLDCQKVFNSIPFYQKLKRDGLHKKSGRYWILLQKANRIFYKALQRLSRERGYDLIGARNSIVIDGASPTDVTESLVEIIPSITLD